MLLLLAFTPGVASAHVRSTTGFSEITQEGRSVLYELSLEYDLFVGELGLGQEALEASTVDRRRKALDLGRAAIADYLDSRLHLSLDGIRCVPALAGVGIETRQAISYARSLVRFDCAGSPAGSYEISYGVFADSIVDEHINLVDYRLGDESGRLVFDGAHLKATIGEAGLLSSAGSFVFLGVEHILGGLDHILFLVALLLGARSLRSIFKIATTFTAAHSITLGLAVVGWIELPSHIVEPLIALSIAYIAIENIIGGESRERLLVVFGFGLFHGLGFAGTLSFTDEVSWRLLASLLTFNLGIELGQALVVALVFPLLAAIRRLDRPLSLAAHAGATSLIAILGLVWFFDRLSV